MTIEQGTVYVSKNLIFLCLSFGLRAQMLAVEAIGRCTLETETFQGDLPLSQ